MTLAFVALIAGLALLVWSADKFVDGAAATARYAGMPPLLIGMVIIGFGTSAPEMVVSALARTPSARDSHSHFRARAAAPVASPLASPRRT